MNEEDSNASTYLSQKLVIIQGLRCKRPYFWGASQIQVCMFC